MVEANSQRGSRRSILFLLALIIVPCAIFAGFFVRHRLACVTGPGLASLWRFGEQSDSSADLSLARTPIQDDSLVHLQNWRWLQHLDLSHTKITDRGLAFLEAMGPMLSRVDIGGTEVIDHGVEQLKSSHPGLSINR